MTRSLRTRVGALVFICLLLLSGAAETWAQYRVRVYRPGRYNRTRGVMSNRAAMRAALKRKKQRQKARRKILRRTVNQANRVSESGRTARAGTARTGRAGFRLFLLPTGTRR